MKQTSVKFAFKLWSEIYICIKALNFFENLETLFLSVMLLGAGNLRNPSKVPLVKLKARWLVTMKVFVIICNNLHPCPCYVLFFYSYFSKLLDHSSKKKISLRRDLMHIKKNDTEKKQILSTAVLSKPVPANFIGKVG